MKKVLLILTMVFSIGNSQQTAIAGLKPITNKLVTWTVGANTGVTRLMFRGDTVFADTSARAASTGIQVSPSWKRIHNTADSCSQPFNLGTDTTGTTFPLGWLRLVQKIKAVDVDSSTHIYRVQTRDVDFIANNYGGVAKKRFRQWTPYKSVSGDTLGNVQDWCLMKNLNAGSGALVDTNYTQYCHFVVYGTQARLCPDDVAATAGQTNDSIVVDSITYYPR